MKKTLLFIAAILMSVSVFAQTRTVLISEHFNGSSLPDGWQIIGQESNWSVSVTQNAGGQANEMKLDWSPQFNGITRLATPAVDLTGVTSVVFSFKHALDNYQGSNSISIATSSDGGTTWNDAWTQAYSSSGAWSITQNITTTDMGNNSVMFCVYFNGNSYNINDWYFDDIEIFTLENLDLALNSIDINNTVAAGSNNIAFTVLNKGVETINNFKMSYQIDNQPAVEEVITTSLATLESSQFTFAVPVTLTPGSYSLTVTILEVNGDNDDDPSNNSLEKTFDVALGSTQRIPMIEHFSSSTCGPCVNVNTTMLNFTNTHPGMFTYTKYQMNWPGNGDPYYTAEGGTRRTYYGVNAVPQCFLDGEDQGYAAVQTTVFDQHYANPAFADVRGSFNVSGNIITVKVDFMAFYDENSARAFVSVNEKETHNNVGGNGETTFHHIFMKFLTSASGNTVNIPAGECQHFEFTQDMSGTHVEEMSDLEVSAWIQNYNSKEMLNSHFLYEYTDIHPYPVQNLAVALDGSTLTATWTAPEGGNALSYNIYVNGELATNTTELSYTTTVTSDYNVVAIEAVYVNDMTSVKIVKDIQSPATTLTLSTTDLVFDEMTEEKHLIITNNTADAVTISEIAENPETEYLAIEFEGLIVLPYTLEQGESMQVNIAPSIVDRAQVTTFINIVSTVGTQSVNVTVDSSWFDGVEENNHNYNIYPNPTNDNITVCGNNISMVEIYNICGQKVMSVEANSSNVNVNLSEFSTGVYMVKVVDNNGNATVNKVVKK